MFSKTLCSLVRCAPALSLGRASDFRHDNRCNRARHFVRLCASARRPGDIASSRCFSRSLRLVFGRSNYERATMRTESKSWLERTSRVRSRKSLGRELTARGKEAQNIEHRTLNIEHRMNRYPWSSAFCLRSVNAGFENSNQFVCLI